MRSTQTTTTTKKFTSDREIIVSSNVLSFIYYPVIKFNDKYSLTI